MLSKLRKEEMFTLLKLELFKIIKRPRTYIGFGSVFFIVLAFQVSMYFQGQSIISFILDNLETTFRMEGSIINANLVTYILLNSLMIHIPILICLVTGDIISGESSQGTIRLILQKPFSRMQIYGAKVISGVIYTLALMLLMGLSAYGIGYLLFGNGDLVVVKVGINIFNQNDLIWRFFWAFIIGTLSMLVVTALSIMISSFSTNSIVPIVGTIAIIIVLNVLTVLGYSLFEPILPYVFTTHFNKWQELFEFTIDFGEVYLTLFVQIAYILTFLTIGAIHFKNKDILS